MRELAASHQSIILIIRGVWRGLDEASVCADFFVYFECNKKTDLPITNAGHEKLEHAMKVRLLGAMMMVAMLAGTVRAQEQLPAPKDLPKAKDSPAESSVPSTGAEAMPADLATPHPSQLTGWLSADYTVGWLPRTTYPALVTTSPAGVPQASAGILGRNTTNLLLGMAPFGTSFSNGGHLDAGVGLMDGLTVELTGFFLLSGRADFHAASNGNNNSAPIARPFFEPITGQEAAAFVAFPGRLAGSIDVHLHTILWGIDGTVVERFHFGLPVTLGLGFRYLNLSDTLAIDQTTAAVSAPALSFNGKLIPLTDSVQITDSFRTQNQFIGPQLSLRYQKVFDPLSVEVLAKLALGSTQETIVIAGASSHLSPASQVLATGNGGFLAAPSNIGTYTNGVFSVVPELNLKLGYHLNRNLNVFVGYDFLCWTNVVRASEPIDRTVNLTQIPTAAVFNPNFGPPGSPSPPTFRSADLIVHSIKVGLEWKF
jgi:hypothetical protein